ncbi:MAG: hypothetical protein WBE26_14920 [Phycisphaerae bacterium]
MIAQRSPRAWRRRGLDEKNSADGIITDPFPLCKLHGCRVVSQFPESCPLRAKNPLDRIYAIRQRGWRQLGDHTTDDHRGGLALLAIDDICSTCMDRMLGHRHVRYLRDKGANNE